MNNINNELEKAWKKAQNFPGQLELLGPSELESEFAALAVMKMLETIYAHHGVSDNLAGFEAEIKSGQIEPWIVTRSGKPVACAALIHQRDGSVEIGRAVSIENGTGVGKIAMLSAADNRGSSPLVAEVRVAGKFAGVPGSEATQRICLDLLNLVPHALLFAFDHGVNPLRREMFAFSAEGVELIDHSPILTAKDTLSNRSLAGPIRNLRLVQNAPFRVAVPDDLGCSVSSFSNESRAVGGGFTLVPVEVTDQNLGTIGSLLSNEFEIVGLDRKLGQFGLPVIWLSTIARGEVLAPTMPSSVLPRQLRQDIQTIDHKFQILTRGN